MKTQFRVIFMLCLWALVSAVGIHAQEPSTLRLGSTLIIDTLNPANGFYGYGVRTLFHDTLIQWAGEDRFEPGLAESWEVSEDGLTWTFKIREGVSFTDGTPVDAPAIAWGLNWIIENEAPSMLSYMSNIATIEASDATTLQITVETPVADMISSKFLYTWILPESVWGSKTGDEITSYAEVDAALGSGPYKVVDFQESEYLILEANENYWGGTPPVERIIYQEYANEDAMVQALIAGDIDFIGTVPASGAQPLLDDPNVEVSIGNAFQLEELIINSSPDGTQPASLNDPIVRTAIAHAVDKEQIAIVGYLGYAQPAVSFLPASYGAFHNDQIVDIPFDLDEGNRILDEAGFVDSNGDGIREYSDGTPLEYRLFAPESEAYYARIIEIISNDLAVIGISAPAVVLADDSLIALQPDYDNDMIYWGWFLDPDPSFATSIFTCDETVDGGWSDSGYCNPDYDALYQAQSTAVDMQDRIDILWQAQELIFKDKPYIPVVYPQALSAYRSDRFTFDANLAALPLRYALFNGFQSA